MNGLRIEIKDCLLYTSNIGVPKYIKKILEDVKKDIDSNTVIVQDFNIPLSKMGRSSKQIPTRYCSIEQCPRSN